MLHVPGEGRVPAADAVVRHDPAVVSITGVHFGQLRLRPDDQCDASDNGTVASVAFYQTAGPIQAPGPPTIL
jgi:hypothetical protein